MGHVQPGGAPEPGKPAVVQPEVAADPLWPAWRALTREFRLRRLLWHLTISPSGWGFFGIDVVSTLRRTPMAKAGLAQLAPMSDALLVRLTELAAVNARRCEAMWRMSALFYITVPVTLFLAGLQGAPEFLREQIAALGWFGALMLVGVMLQMLHYFAALWRARQIEAVIDLARIERGHGASLGSRP